MISVGNCTIGVAREIFILQIQLLQINFKKTTEF